jgi:cytochrome c-type biogenesis protein
MHDAFSLTLLGLVYGATVCSFTCLPYLAPYLMGSGSGFGDGFISSLAFISGKICTYGALGGIAAVFGQAFSLNHSHNMIMGITLLCVALTLPLVTRRGCRKRCQVVGKRGSLFVLGIVSSLVPCPPLAAIFVLAANKGSLFSGIAYGLLYGTGLMLSPMLIAGGGLAMISDKIKKEAQGFAPYMQGLAMLVMMLMAVNMMMTV